MESIVVTNRTRTLSGRRVVWLRGGLSLLTFIDGALGVWVLVSPEGFFSLPWVNLGMDYNPHLMLDYGAMNLAAAVVLGAGAVTMRAGLVRAALVSYLLWSFAHFLIHLHFAAHTAVAGLPILLVLLGLGVAIPLALLVVAFPRRQAEAVNGAPGSASAG
ncbi:hypothetical protein AB0F18_30425 [Streptomyces sp. NPDC029216]|uniref:hypothetical protein n=1 Tax=Streptomyces sp. NPDC029216 TaxID=3154701 RepID=UPI0034048005